MALVSTAHKVENHCQKRHLRSPTVESFWHMPGYLLLMPTPLSPWQWLPYNWKTSKINIHTVTIVSGTCYCHTACVCHLVCFTIIFPWMLDEMWGVRHTCIGTPPGLINIVHVRHTYSYLKLQISPDFQTPSWKSQYDDVYISITFWSRNHWV